MFDETVAQLTEEESKKQQEPLQQQGNADEQVASPPAQITETPPQQDLKETALPRVMQTELMGTA